MFIELIVAILLGCLLGVISGITPGLHINLVSVIILSSIPFFLQHFSVYGVATIIIAMSITHTFTDFIPSIFLGAANDDTALSVLPGHRMLMEGKALLAIQLSVIGGFFSLLFIVILSPLFLIITKPIYDFVRPFIAYILIAVSLFVIFRQKEKNKIFWAAFVFIMSGILGLIALNSNFKEPLLPMLSGLFGVSALLFSLKQKVSVPRQNTYFSPVRIKQVALPVVLSTFAATFVSIFPAITSAHSAVIARQFFKKITSEMYIVLLGGISSVSMFFSLITLYSINKARNGSIIVVQKILPAFTLNDFLLFSAVSIIACAIAVFLTLEIAKLFAENILAINYQLISIAVILFVMLLTIVFSGPIGLLILLSATSIGIITIAMDVDRTCAMGCLLLPVIFYFL